MRFISNRSSGLTGYHLAETAASCGFEPFCFISGPVARLPRAPREIVSVESAAEMRGRRPEPSRPGGRGDHGRRRQRLSPGEVSGIKIKKGADELVLRLVKNPDILSEIGRRVARNSCCVGFAAETDRGAENARDKLLRKNADLIVLNLVSRDNPAFGDCRNRVSFVTRETVEDLPPLEKEELARRIWARIAALARKREADTWKSSVPGWNSSAKWAPFHHSAPGPEEERTERGSGSSGEGDQRLSKLPAPRHPRRNPVPENVPTVRR